MYRLTSRSVIFNRYAAGALVLAAVPASATADFQAELDRLRVNQDIPGVSAVVTHADRVLFAGASGLADLESERPMTAETPLYAGSLTKILTAVLALSLVEDNKLSMSASVAEFEQAASRDARKISTAHLLTHAAGLEREGNFDYWFTGDFPDRNLLVDYLQGARLRSPPGTALHYSNVGYAALGLAIERVSGRTYPEALQAQVLEPLQMPSSGAPGPAARIATGYTPVGRIIPNEQRAFAGVGRRVGKRHVREYHNAKAMSPAFGAYTSANDLGRLARFLLGHGGDDVLSRDMRSRMRTRQASGWGLGLKVQTVDGRPVARHEGWFAAHRSHLMLDVENDIGVVVLTNSDGASPARIAEVLWASVL